MRLAQERAYDLAEDVILPNKFYRNDIGDRWFGDVELLVSWGYLRET